MIVVGARRLLSGRTARDEHSGAGGSVLQEIAPAHRIFGGICHLLLLGGEQSIHRPPPVAATTDRPPHCHLVVDWFDELTLRPLAYGTTVPLLSRRDSA